MVLVHSSTIHSRGKRDPSMEGRLRWWLFDRCGSLYGFCDVVACLCPCSEIRWGCCSGAGLRGATWSLVRAGGRLVVVVVAVGGVVGVGIGV